MSRIGKQPVAIPAGVKVRVADGKVSVEGPKGAKLEHALPPQHDGRVRRERQGDQSRAARRRRQNRALHGLTRSLIANMVEGVTKGYEKRLKIDGIGYQARMDKKAVMLTVGFANPITLRPPDGVTVEVPRPDDDHRRARTSRRSASSPPRSAMPGRRNRTRARASATRTNRSAARKASPSPAAADRGDHESPEVEAHTPASAAATTSAATSPARWSGRG